MHVRRFDRRNMEQTQEYGPDCRSDYLATQLSMTTFTRSR
jgi:hypothetical protein